jgi:hypothetical protein
MTMTAIGVHENTEIGMHENSENNGNIEIATSVAATSTIVTVMIGTASAQPIPTDQIVAAVVALRS